MKVARGETFHVDTLDLYASRSRTEFAKRACKAFGVEPTAVEAELLALVVEAEKRRTRKPDVEEPRPRP